ncbi:spermine oxidase [Aplysia californica]|uniref:Spermine oxidase n=1 Tax=Aplysia californica TaxID=6500 RepID=A0ABM0JF22_APLCA|nr:spermine oxidase [Aplysia californica]
MSRERVSCSIMEGGGQEKSKKRQPKTIIIGGGIAGLAAGKYLQLEGFNDFLILEASDRIGGRIWSVPVDDNGHKAELGANWIHGVKHNPIYKIADENNLLTERELHLNSKNIYKTELGETIFEGTVKKVDFAYGTMLTSCEDYFLSHIPIDVNESVGSELDRLILEKLANTAGEERQQLELVYHQRRLLECCISGCDSLYDVSLSQFGSYKELPGRHLVIPRGFSAILDIVREGIPEDRIKLNSPVRKIHWGDVSEGQCPEDMVSVECESGDIYYADHVIVTVSLGVLKAACDRMFTPELPLKKKDAIHHLGFGVVNKVILVFDGPVLEKPTHRIHLAWDPAVNNEENLRERWYRKIYSLEVVHDNVLVGWLSGKEALFLESLTDDEVLEAMDKVVHMFLQGQDIPTLKKVIRTSWGNNKNSRGSYSFIAVGSTQEDILHLKHPLTKNLQDNTKKPVVLFAGEATHPSFYSTTHGALVTGNREAARICKFWKPAEDAAGRYADLGLSDAENTEEEESSEDEGLCFM